MYDRTDREDLRKLTWDIQNVSFQDAKVKDFTEMVDWKNFVIGEIYKHMQNQKRKLSEQQRKYIEDYVQKQVPTIQWDKELCSDKKGTTSYTRRLIYTCYFIIKLDIDTPKEFVKNMITLPKFFLHEENQRSEDGKTDNLDGYICSRLSEHEIVMQLKKIAKEQILYGSMAERYIEWCEKYKTDAGREIAERILEDRECKQYDRKQCFTYLQKIMTGEHLVDKYLEKIAGMTEEIAGVDNPVCLDILTKLMELCFRDGFRDGEIFGLYDSVYKALLNIASGAAEVVLEKLGNLRNQTDNKEVKGCCNNMILNIEKQYYEQLDVPWTMQEIKHLNSQWSMV